MGEGSRRATLSAQPSTPNKPRAQGPCSTAWTSLLPHPPGGLERHQTSIQSGSLQSQLGMHHVLEALTLLAVVFRSPWILGATLPLALSEAAHLCSFLRDEMQQRAARIETLPGSCVPNTVPGLDTRQVRAELPSTAPPPPSSRERFLKARGEGPPG